jgi:UDP:flavonoid glycosyltransferase YjiC (YdhE family)
VTLAKGLKARGHDVWVGALASGRVLVERAGLAYRLIPGKDVDEALNHPAVIEALSKGPSRSRMVKAIPKQPREDVVRVLKAVEDIATGADMVVHTVLTMSVAYAMSDSPPWCYLATFPNTVTGDFPALGFRSLGNLRTYNRLTHELLRAAEWRLWRRREINMLRADNGLPPYPRRSPMRDIGTDIPVIYPFSPAVVAPPADWPANNHVTGYLFADEDLPEQPEIDRFLDDGEPPILVSFGSGWPVHKRLGTARTVLEAARALRLRTIMVDGPDDLDGADLLQVSDIDYRQLLPRTAAVVHHGGFGTTGEMFRAGVPQVVFPTLADNPYWAARVYALGVGVRPLSVRRSNRAVVTASLEEVTTSAEIRANNARLAARIRAEKGVTDTCDKVEQLFGSREAERGQDGAARTV